MFCCSARAIRETVNKKTIKMEENMIKLFNQVPSIDHLKGELFQTKNLRQSDWDDVEISKESTPKLSEEEQTLKIYLDKLKKENFTLRASIKAWQTTLEVKLEEFKKDRLKLEEKYNEIWSEREKFCSKLEKFNDEYGVLSNWWEAQVQFVSELENPEKASEEKQEIDKLEEEVANLKKELEELQKPVMEVQEGDSVPNRDESKSANPKEEANFWLENKENEIYKRGGDSATDLYSLVDLEKVKMAKWRRNFYCRGKKAVKTPTLKP